MPSFISPSVNRTDGTSIRGAARQLSYETLFAARHRPAMVRRKNRLENRRKDAQEWLLRADAPVVRDDDVVAVLNEQPFAASDEIAERFDHESIAARFDDAKAPAQFVR